MKIAFGTDTGVSAHGDNAQEFALLVQAGMTPLQAIQAATVNAADHLQLSGEIGTPRARQGRRPHRRAAATRCATSPS